ncbi:MAG: HNH endonuclease [Desulfuromonadales bacterium]|nr:HNH endonuclease [Desulfuromonadales bacterium]
MKIYVTNEHFFQNWFVFKDGNERDWLLELSNNLMDIHVFEEENNTCVAIRDRDTSLLKGNDTWQIGPILRFSVSGIYVNSPEINNNKSKFSCCSIDTFFNAEIDLSEICNMSIKFNDITKEELITYAKFKWCQDLGFNYLHQEKAQDIELRLQNDISADYTDEYEEFINSLRKMPYKNYLRTKHWRHFRSEEIKFFQNKCQMCSSIEKEYSLHLHHNSYKNRGRETFNDVILLCKKCHQKHHK